VESRKVYTAMALPIWTNVGLYHEKRFSQVIFFVFTTPAEKYCPGKKRIFEGGKEISNRKCPFLLFNPWESAFKLKASCLPSR
jgi:hypothetical protein